MSKKRVEEEDVVPPHVAKHILSSYTLSNPTSKRAVSDYVESQAIGESVQHAEKVRSENVYDRDYDCWDVHTDKDRYWVITSPTNLYSQEYFPSLDYTLSFHIGVTARIMAAQRGAPDKANKSRLSPVWRRWEDAAASRDRGEEAEDFQSVGMKCRECLVQVIRSTSKREMVPLGAEVPKASDVVGWTEHIANHIAPGDRNGEIRSHLKMVVKSTWQLDNWLTHAAGATRMDATIALDATAYVLATLGMAIIRFESKNPERCAECGSYSLNVDYNADLLPRPYTLKCEKCGWLSQEPR